MTDVIVMAKNYFIITLVTIIICCSMKISAEELLFPLGYDITCNYDVNKTHLKQDDTLIITRSFINNESFPLSGLYFSEYVPLGLYPESYTLTINSIAISNNYEISPNSIHPGCMTIHWIIDDPDGSVNNQINTGDSLTLTYSLISLAPGIYHLPMHTSSFYGSTEAFFSFGDSFSVNFECCLIRGDINNDNSGPDVSDLTFFVNYIFKDGLTPLCIESADMNYDGNILIDDAVYLINYIFKGGPPPPPC